MILLIDNFDSFSYNLYQMIGEIEPNIKVVRNDAISIEEIEKLSPEAIIISPGPGRPEDAGICIEVVKRLSGKFPILGVCLGHQSICAAYGATVTYAKKLMHGKQSITELSKECKLFRGLNDKELVARYHSLAADNDTIPDTLEIVARTDDGEVMAVKAKGVEVYGVQFHPESVLTPNGNVMLKNFIDIARGNI